MKTIHIYFTDFWDNFDNENNFIFNLLSIDYHIIIDSIKPEYLFFSCYGYNHLNYNTSVKIYYTGENLVPDFNLCDYAIGFHYLNFDDRYLRLPLFAIRDEFKKLQIPKKDIQSNLLSRKFCNFIYSNTKNADPIRTKFLKNLNEYKKVDCGGAVNNNIGYLVNNKLEFISNYKFTIAFENSAVSGYTTEKLIESMAVNSIPIYWGNPRIGDDFNINSFVFLKDENNIKNAIDEIILLDNDNELYLNKLSQPWLQNNFYIFWENILLNFLNNIINKSTTIDAKYISSYGRAREYFNSMYSFFKSEKLELKPKTTMINRFKLEITSLLKR